MKQRVLVEKPPVYDRCVHAFGQEVIVGKPIIWSWGDVIYNPTNIDISRELLAHEAVHGVRQIAHGLEKWWDLYLQSRDFRYNEEVLAHRAEWQHLAKWGKADAKRLALVAGRLASPLYGNMLDPADAEFELLRRG